MALFTTEQLNKASRDPKMMAAATRFAVAAAANPTELHFMQAYYAAGAEAAGASADHAVQIGNEVATMSPLVRGASDSQFVFGALGYMLTDSRLTFAGVSNG